jgi:monofunctional biosynthetic peptidoglycan transglycosylase
MTMFVLGLLLLPVGLIALFSILDPPITPLMIIRKLDGAPIHQTWRSLENIPPHMIGAVIAAEDNRFCEHWGFDVEATQSQLEAWLSGNRPLGASTITMQTAKNVYLWPDRSVTRKILEAVLTPQIELIWSKRRIMEVYLNVIEFGPGIYGVDAASRQHFGISVSALNPRQSALLAAVLPNPLSWSAATPSPYIQNRAATIQRRVAQLGPLLQCVAPDMPTHFDHRGDK